MRAAKTRTEIRKEQIARAALTAVARVGVANLSIGTVAEEVGVVPSAIYRHYPSKEGVLDVVLELISQHLAENVRAVTRETLNALERLEQLLDRHIQLIYDNPGIPRIVFSEEIIGSKPARRKRLHQIIQDYLGQVEGIISGGQAQGCIRAEISAATASVLFLGLVQPTAFLHLLSDGDFDLARFKAEAWPAFRGLLARRVTSIPEQQTGSTSGAEITTRKTRKLYEK